MQTSNSGKEIILSFILLNYNNADYTVPCIESIQKTLEVPYEIIVVDNASADDSLERLSKIEDITLVKNSANRGFTGGNNDGVRAARGKYVVILNNDTTVYASNINELPAVFDSYGRYDVIGGRMVGIDGKAQTSGGFEPSPVIFYLQFILLCYIYIKLPWLKSFWFAEWTDNRVVEVDWAGGCFFAMRRDTYMELGGFDENIFIYLDEVDLHKRTREKGGHIYLYPNFIIQHYGFISWRGNNHVGVRHNYNSASYYLGKYYSRFHKLLFISAVKLINLLYLPGLFIMSLFTIRKVKVINDKLKICWTLLLA
jgi:GT2 family glycosyltransferase